MRVLFACGGTAGHINPALATAECILKHDSKAEIMFVGNPRGMEARLVAEAGYRFMPVRSKGFYRSFSPKAIAHNISAVYYMLMASGAVKKILDDFQPDIVMGTGGYVSGPVLRTAAKLNYKCVTHEQNAFPGVTTKLLSKYVDKVLLAVPEAEKYLESKAQCIVVGNPVREEIELAANSPERCRRELNIPADKTVILSFGGSLGAQRINEAVADIVKWHYKSGKIYHIHATGQYGVELFPRLLNERGVDTRSASNLDIREYISDMPRCLGAADVVICRAGAITLSELQVAGRAAILIPSPNVAENHQYHNAMAMGKKKAAIVIEEKDVTGDALCDIVKSLVMDREYLTSVSRAAKRMAMPHANELIRAELLKTLGK